MSRYTNYESDVLEAAELIQALEAVTDYPDRVRITLCDGSGGEGIVLSNYFSPDMQEDVISVVVDALNARKTALLSVLRQP